MSTQAEHQAVDAYLLQLHAEDPYAAVRQASEVHRLEHAQALEPPGEQNCGVFPSDPLKAQLLGTLACAVGARRILEIGGGLGYSALWLAQGITPDATVETIDRYPEHVAIIRQHAHRFGFSDRLAAIEGDAESLLQSLDGPYDLIHDDGWFGKQPDYFDRMLSLLRPGGTLAISNWFLLEQSIVAEPSLDWSHFAGPSWKDDIRSYATNLAARPDLDLAFVSRPWLALAVKKQ